MIYKTQDEIDAKKFRSDLRRYLFRAATQSPSQLRRTRADKDWCKYLGKNTIIKNDSLLQVFFAANVEDDTDWNPLYLQYTKNGRSKTLSLWYEAARELLQKQSVKTEKNNESDSDEDGDAGAAFDRKYSEKGEDDNPLLHM